MRPVVQYYISFVLLLFLLIGFRQHAQAQSITFQDQNGHQVASWKDGDRITVVVQGGSSNAKWVDIVRQTGHAGAAPVSIYWTAYSPARGLRYTFTAYYPGYVSITAIVRTGPSGSWITGNSLFKNQR